MQFHKGDKVRFLNETGSGIVTKIMGNGMMMIEVEDGFEYPYPANQLVAAEPNNEKEEEGKRRPDSVQVNAINSTIENRAAELFIPNYTDGIYIAFIPKHQQFPSAGEIELVLYNHSDYDIYFAMSLKDGRDWSCIQSGSIAPRRNLKIDTLTPQVIDDWGTLKTDLLFFKHAYYEHRAPVSDQLKLRGVKFFKDATYTTDLLTGKRAYISEIEILEPSTVAKDANPFLSNDYINRMLAEKEKTMTGKKFSIPHLKNQVLEKEIDLHIEELLENWTGMTNGQLIAVQLKKVQQELDEAMTNRLQRIVFIHGVGNGRLKTEVIKILSECKGIRFQDASYQRYGYGATEVVFY